MIEVIHPGTQSTLQDTGRPGYRRLGIPASGAGDPLSMALANYCVGNAYDAATLEATRGGLSFTAQTSLCFALAGAQTDARLNDRVLPFYTPLTAQAGDTISLGRCVRGMRTYVAFSGGLSGQDFLGSVATYPPAALGGLDGTSLKVGDTLFSANQPVSTTQTLPPGYAPHITNHMILRVWRGPDMARLSGQSQYDLFQAQWQADEHTNRMGARLNGAVLEFSDHRSMSSSPILSGTLQVPPDGQPILALTDGHCTGGYVRALQVIRPDLWLLGQIGPGTRISFRRDAQDEALNILTRRNALYGSLINGFTF